MGVKKTVLMVVAFVAATLAVAPAVSAQAQVVRAAINSTPPTGGNPPAGLCFELLSAIGEQFGWRVEFTPVSGLTNLLKAVTGSTADVACSGIAPTNDRRKLGLAFTSPFFTNSEFLYVRADDPTPYTSLAEFSGKKVAGQQGSTFLRALKSSGLEELTYPDNTAGFAAIAAGEIDGYVTGVQSRYLTDVTKSIEGVRSVDTYVPTLPTPASLVVRATDTQLLGQLQAGLEVLKAEGKLNDMVKNWSLSPSAF